MTSEVHTESVSVQNNNFDARSGVTGVCSICDSAFQTGWLAERSVYISVVVTIIALY